MRHLKSIILGIFAGIAISFGGLVNLVCKSLGHPLVGNILFSVGLLIVCSFGLYLFTGKIGYVFHNKLDYVIDLGEMYIGNLIGATGIGYIARLCTKETSDLFAVAEQVSNSKLLGPDGSSWYKILLFGILCGILVYLAVDGFKNEKYHPVLRVFILVFCVSAFVVAGFEHCIANMFYFAFGNAYGVNFGMTVVSILLCTLGNAIGAIVLNEGIRFAKSPNKEKTE